MKLFDLVPSIIKAFIGVTAFLVGVGWSAFVAVNMIVKAEGGDIRREVKTIRDIDMQHLDKRFDRIETLIKDTKK